MLAFFLDIAGVCLFIMLWHASLLTLWHRSGPFYGIPFRQIAGNSCCNLSVVHLLFSRYWQVIHPHTSFTYCAKLIGI